MTVKEELEILRGEPITTFEGDPLKIPYIETSDAERLCKHPIVSVHMMAYKHEPYIRQAIEGVMKQQTDFEFELVLSEDCSPDKTREICFEYQKKYPDKIRVLWWHENVTAFGGNGRRTSAHCRGEFITFCEGDDYWTDPLKLQKQVDIMRKHPDVGLCFCNSEILLQNTGEKRMWAEGEKPFPQGWMPGLQFFLWHLFGQDFTVGRSECFIMTATVMLRASIWKTVRQRYEIFKWRLYLGDTPLWLAMAALSNVYYLPDVVSVYRQNGGGICFQAGTQVWRDACLARVFYLRDLLAWAPKAWPIGFRKRLEGMFIRVMKEMPPAKQREYAKSIWNSGLWRVLLASRSGFPFYAIARMGLGQKQWAERWATRISAPEVTVVNLFKKVSRLLFIGRQSRN